jgi:hypothetical protein
MDKKEWKTQKLKIFEHKRIKTKKTKTNRWMFFVFPQNVALNPWWILNKKRACSHSQTFLDQELRVQNSWSTKWHAFSDKKVSIWKPKP